MLGYGLINAGVQEFCLEQIIFNFFNRSILLLLPFYIGIKFTINKKNPNIKGTKIFLEKISLQNLDKKEKALFIDPLYRLFVREEYLLTKKNINSGFESDYQRELYKYILTANLISNKDYNFDAKTPEQVIEDGRASLTLIFEKLLVEFLNNSKILSNPKYLEEKDSIFFDEDGKQRGKETDDAFMIFLEFYTNSLNTLGILSPIIKFYNQNNDKNDDKNNNKGQKLLINPRESSLNILNRQISSLAEGVIF